MMQLRKLFMIGLFALALAAVPTPAAAQDWFFTPFIGANFGGSAAFGDFPALDDEVERRMDFGATLGWTPGIVGFEVDFGYSPNFFENTAGDSNFEFGDSNVTTIMANINFSGPNISSGVRPYASTGLGIIRSSISNIGALFDDVSTNDLGLNVGGGVQGYFNDKIGIRGDIRYFRSLQDNQPDNGVDLAFADFDFWRGTVGLTFRW